MATWGTGVSLRGLQGVIGTPGSKTTFITGAPTDQNASANAGDMAFATDTNLFYQRGTDGWPSNGTLLRGAMGINGVDGFFGAGPDAPTDDLGADANGIYFQSTGELWTRQKGASWVDSGENYIGPKGDKGDAGTRGSLNYSGVGAPSSDLSTFNPPALSGDIYYDRDPNNAQAPVQYFLN